MFLQAILYNVVFDVYNLCINANDTKQYLQPVEVKSSKRIKINSQQYVFSLKNIFSLMYSKIISYINFNNITICNFEYFENIHIRLLWVSNIKNHILFIISFYILSYVVVRILLLYNVD